MTSDLRERLQEALAERYTLERELGRGGMATVYLAQDLKHDRPVAFKVLHPELAATLGPERFQLEIRTTARLQHPHILPVLDSGETAGQFWYTMPYVRGESLRDRLRREGQLPVDTAIDLAHQVALALEHAHRQGIVHRDLKPENILISDDQALVADFGVAKALEDAGQGRLTVTGLVVGTPQYMAPEQAGGGQVDARTDVYALACVLYELLSGEPPYTGTTPQSITIKRVTDPVPSVRRLRTTVPSGVDGAIVRALAPVPADRFPSAGVFASALRMSEPAADSGDVRQEVGRVPSRRGPRGVLLIVLAGLALGLLVLWALQRPGEAAPSTDQKMLAVLPFENLGRPEDEYFADGLTEDISGRLGSVQNLGVIGRASTAQYKGSDKPLKAIGHELGVDYVLKGSVRWESSPGERRLRVTPQLIHVADERQVWSDRYDAKLANTFQVQGDIADRVAQALSGALVKTDRVGSSARSIVDPEAYDLYLRANAYLNGAVTERNVRSAVPLLEKAIAVDPQFALAYARLSQAYSQLYWFEWDRTPARLAAARLCAERALQIAPNSPEAHLAMGTYFGRARGPGQSDSAEREFAAARTIAPSNTEALLGLAGIMAIRGEWSDQIEMLEQVARLEPRSSRVGLLLTEAMLRHRRFTEALTYADRAIAIAPDNAPLYALKAAVLINARADVEGAREVVRQGVAAANFSDIVNWLDGPLDWLLLDADGQAKIERMVPKDNESGFESDYLLLAEWYHFRKQPALVKAYSDSARVILSQRVETQPQDPDAQIKLGLAFALVGQRQEALAHATRATELTAKSKWRGTDYVIDLAWVATLVGDFNLALDLLQRVLAMPSRLSVTGVQVDPAWEPLRNLPRFQELVHKRQAGP